MTENDTAPVIVVGVDGSETGKRALRWAARQAELTGADLHAIRAWQSPINFGFPADYTDVDFAGDARTELDRAVEEVLGADHRVLVAAEVAEGHPAQVLIKAAESADLLVVGSHGRGAFTGAILGSVSQHCVQHATCPVLVVRNGASGPADG